MSSNFNKAFNLLKSNYEKKEKNNDEAVTYELLKKLIQIYGYDSICDEISVYNEKNESKNKELSIIMNEAKKKVSIELLCSQLFYLDNSNIFDKKNNLNSEQTKNKNNSKINLTNGEKKRTIYKFKVLKNKNQ